MSSLATGTRWLGLFAFVLFFIPSRSARAEASAHLSEEWLPSSNGWAAIAWDREQLELVQFLEHPYATASDSAQTRNFAGGSFAGVRIGSTGTWLNGVPPTLTEYVAGTGVIHSQRSFSGLSLDEYEFTPMGFPAYASVTIVEVMQTGTAGPIDLYSLFNYHLGSGSPSPGTDSESITYDPSRDAYYETGPAGVGMAYVSLLPSTHHGCTPNNPYGLLNAGSSLADDPGTGAPVTDAVAGFQSSLGTLAPGAATSVGWMTLLAPDANGAAAVDAARAWVNGRSPAQLLADEISGWQTWTTSPPIGASALEASLDLQAQVVLRMGQVQEDAGGQGQLLASLAPGQLNFARVRDMAYATVGLVRSGHAAEAKAALAFQLGAQTGTYQAEVGAPYLISVARYYGDGTEWSDSTADGPNIELDGFGLFLWALDEYVTTTGDTQSLAQWWPAVKSQVADALVGLQEYSGLIEADSSIWETHWDGQQKHYGYTTVAAANGLCAASRLAQAAGDTTAVAGYLAAGQQARDALLTNLRTPDGTLVQSVEQLASGAGFLDSTIVEAINFGLIDPSLRTATATLASVEAGLTPQSGRGLMRGNLGDPYSSSESVFSDLRAARATELAGDASATADLFSWNVAQASDNYGELSELHDPVTADYLGQSPIVGMGAGAYLVRLAERGQPVAPTCTSFAAEPSLADGGTDGGLDGGMDGGFDAGQIADAGLDAGQITDAGVDAGNNVDAGLDAGPSTDAGADAGVDAGHDAGSMVDAGPDAGSPADAGALAATTSGGCGCRSSTPNEGTASLWPLVPLMLLVLRRRR